MRAIHTLSPGNVPTLSDVHDAIGNFHALKKVRPLAIKMSFKDLSDFFKCMNLPALVSLEAGKVYENHLQTVFGPVRLSVLDDDNAPQGIIVIENDEIDKAFEKHVLGSP